MRTGLSQEGQPFTVPLLRLAQFLRQAGLLPKLLSRLITQMHRVGNLRTLPFAKSSGFTNWV